MRVADRPAVARRVDDAGGQVNVNDGSIVILRTVAAEGRSRRPRPAQLVPEGVLAEIADNLVTVHGQSDHLRLRTASRQRTAHRRIAGPRARRAPRAVPRGVGRAGGAAGADRRHRDARGRARPRGGAAAPRARRGRAGRAPAGRGRRAHRARRAARERRGAPGRRAARPRRRRGRRGRRAAGERRRVGRPRAPRRARVGGRDGSRARPPRRAARRGGVRAGRRGHGDLGLRGPGGGPGGTQSAHARLAELGTLTRSYGETVDDVLAWASDAGLRLLDLDDGGERLQAATARRDELDAELDRLGTAITASREQGRRRAARRP